jgi:predicted SAM-dependent methyltransferase
VVSIPRTTIFGRSLTGAVIPPGVTEPDPWVARAAEELERERAIARLSAAAEQAFADLREESGLKVNLGCGTDVREGWVNIDLFTDGPPPAPGARVVNFDLRRGLPLADGSCSVVYSSHFFEHLEYRDGVRLMRDCHRCLEPGGTFRTALPDLRQDFEAYVRADNRANEEFDELVGPDFGEDFELIRGLEPELRGRARVDYLNYSVYQYGEHRVIYDEEKLRLVLEHIGFRSVTESPFREGLDLDEPLRRKYSFYVEALR